MYKKQQFLEKENIKLETPRTYMRPLLAEDAEAMYQLNLDYDVIKYTGDAPFNSVDHAFDFLINYDQFPKYQVGRFAVFDRVTDDFLGWCGLKFHPHIGEYDLGYRFHKRYWGLGYATETSTKSLEYGFCTLDHIPYVIAHAMLDNHASIKVMQKLGMKYSSPYDFDGIEGVLYKITKEDYFSSLS